MFLASDRRSGASIWPTGLAELVDAAERAIAGRGLAADRQRPRHFARHVAIPSLLAASALHHGLLERRLRSETGIVVESGEPREVMHFCMLCGYGANAINPYMAFEGIYKLRADGDLPAGAPSRC